MLIHAIIAASRANGPGLRAVLFFQGCSLGCRRCWNPRSHPFEAGIETTVEGVAQALVQAKRDHHLEGVTFSGGEPMQQADSLLALMRSLRNGIPTLSLGMFSGYTERELEDGRYLIWQSELTTREKRAVWQAIRSHLDFAVLGRFNILKPSSAPLCSSGNQVLRLFSSRYESADFSEQVTEVHIDEAGAAEVTGFPVLGLPW